MQVDWYAHYSSAHLIRPGVNAGHKGSWHSECVGLLYTKSSHRLAIFSYQQPRLVFDVRNSSCILRDDKDFSEKESQDSHGGLARNENACLPSGVPCYRLGLLPGERPELSIAWGRPAEEGPAISSEGSLVFSSLEDTWSVWCSHQVFLFSIQHWGMHTCS